VHLVKVDGSDSFAHFSFVEDFLLDQLHHCVDIPQSSLYASFFLSQNLSSSLVFDRLNAVLLSLFSASVLAYDGCLVGGFWLVYAVS
jgi:hypothetical protein